MFPNYCFRKPPNDFGYDLLYMPKSSYNSSSQQSNRPEHQSHSRSRSRSSRQGTKLCCDDLISLQALQEHNERLRHSHGLKSRPRTPARTVEFRLPPIEKHRYREATMPLRESAGMESAEREYHQKQQKLQQQQGPPPSSDMPSSASDSNRGMQESCTDFFNIIYENVLEAVHGAVEHMVNKHFEEILTRMDQLSADITHQESVLKQLNADLMGKIGEQNETSLNQFKFVAQMLIDNQTIFYRALSHQRRSKQHCKEEREEREDRFEEKSSASSDRAQRLMETYNRRPDSQPQKVSEGTSQQRPQHQLWQQQDSRSFPQQSPCKSCNHHKSRTANSATAKPTIVRRTAKGISTVSMPDLHRSSLFPTSRSPNNKCSGHHTQRSPTPTPWTQLGTGRLGSQATQSGAVGSNRKCRCLFPSPMTTQGQPVSPRRKLRSLSKTLQSLDDIRSHR
ncbi:uncharacterized protein [Drosophila virilis]|uniref:Uncharacterized protein n=1 Tax=Drosophila virilis TaxID=7244 RepID=B4LYQ7_DROVI|nr:uncharacterized protein LOC6630862 [Drosophila virilis]EDW66984.1 uncharacterized protein Dvir_GJ23326 [Drosophila virilis]